MSLISIGKVAQQLGRRHIFRSAVANFGDHVGPGVMLFNMTAYMSQGARR